MRPMFLAWAVLRKEIFFNGLNTETNTSNPPQVSAAALSAAGPSYTPCSVSEPCTGGRYQCCGRFTFNGVAHSSCIDYGHDNKSK